jgi:multidrug efflux system outer membrane protein
MTRCSTNRSPGHRLNALTTRHAAVAACVLLALAGCASTAPRADRGAAIDVPDAWSVIDTTAAAGPSSLVGWWLRFDDPLFANLIADALQVNTTVTGAQAALRQARALREEAAAALGPKLGSSASAQRSSIDTPELGRTTTNNLQPGLDANWELDFFGVNRNAVATTEAIARASAASLAMTPAFQSRATQ